MATEIELKAHVEDSEALKRRLYEKAEYLESFEKEDNYWFPDGNSINGVSAPFPSGLRVRREKHTPPAEEQRTATIVTYKTKKVSDGIEINDEKEFEIRSLPGQSESAFEDFLLKAGFKPALAKKKHGWAFSHDGITAELVEVDGNNGFRSLGWFVELESLADNKREETITQSRKKLFDFLDSLGIKEEAIESRFYSEMLKNQ